MNKPIKPDYDYRNEYKCDPEYLKACIDFGRYDLVEVEVNTDEDKGE